MNDCPALTCWSGVTNRRGAVFLLAVYFASLALLVLGGVSLQRTMIETRASQVSRDTQQAFYLAEAALDRAITTLEMNPEAILENTDDTKTIAAGISTYRIETVASELIPPDTERLTRQITGIGVAAGKTQEVRAIFAEERRFAGIGAQGGVRLIGDYCGWRNVCSAAPPEEFLSIEGDIRSATGSAPTMHLERIRVTGAISVGDPAAYLDRPPSTNLFGQNYDQDAVYTGAPSNVFLSGQPVRAPLTIQSWTDETFDTLAQSSRAQSLADNPCRDGLEVGGWEMLEVVDGHPCDLTGPGDGQIVLATKYVYVEGNLLGGAYPDAGLSTLMFNSPATVYLTGRRTSYSGDWPLDAVGGYGAYYQGTFARVKAVQNGQTLTDGVQLVIPDWAYEQRNFTYTSRGFWDDLTYEWDIHLSEGEFVGSIWAPQSHVFIEVPDNPSIQFKPGRIIGKNVWVLGWGSSEQLSFLDATSDDPQEPASPVNLLSWTN